MSFSTRTEVSRKEVIQSPTQTTDINSESRPAFSVTRSQTGNFPFRPKAHFSPKISPDVASVLYGLPYYGAGNQSVPSTFPNLPHGIDAVPFYAPMTRLNSKELPTHLKIPHCHFPSYDPAIVASLFYTGGLSSLLFADGQRRTKNATRETTAILKAWLEKHKENPFPTKNEKIMLAFQSTMSLTQVSTWFANARRRLKKENKMTWSPRNRCGEGRDNRGESSDIGFQFSSRNQTHGFTNSQSRPRKHNEEDGDDSFFSVEANIKSKYLHLQSDQMYQRYQQEMLYRNLGCLAPHLQTPEEVRRYQGYANTRLRLETSITAENGTLCGFSSPVEREQSFLCDNKLSFKTGQRRSSLGSPSSSTYDRSPSPQLRGPGFFPNSSSLMRQSTQQTVSSSLSVSCLPSTIQSNQSKSQDISSRIKPAIWSPADTVLDKPSSSKQHSSSTNINYSKTSESKAWPVVDSSPPTPSSEAQEKQTSAFKSGSATTCSSRSEMKSDLNHFTTLPTPYLFSAWMRQFQPQFSPGKSLQCTHALSASFSHEKNAQREQLMPLQHQSGDGNSPAACANLQGRAKSMLRLYPFSQIDKSIPEQDTNLPVDLCKNKRNYNKEVTPATYREADSSPQPAESN